jgi:hypothetical protein
MTRRFFNDLTADADPAWPLVQQWMQTARNHWCVVDPLPGMGERALEQLQVTTHSTLGAVVLHTEAILVDHGWLRLLGAGGPTLTGGILNWNGLSDPLPIPRIKDALIVAHDVVGGFFAIDGGGIQGAKNTVFYLAPDALKWVNCKKGYTDFVRWVFGGDLQLFYRDLRWPNWVNDVSLISADEGFLFDPPLWEDGNTTKRRILRTGMIDIWYLYFNK